MTYVARCLRTSWRHDGLPSYQQLCRTNGAGHGCRRQHATPAAPAGKHDHHFVYMYEPQMDVFWSDLVTNVQAAMPSGRGAGRRARRFTHGDALLAHNKRLVRNYALYLNGQSSTSHLQSLQVRLPPCARCRCRFAHLPRHRGGRPFGHFLCVDGHRVCIQMPCTQFISTHTSARTSAPQGDPCCCSVPTSAPHRIPHH